MTTLVTGGTGFIGWHLVQRLLDNGKQVRLLVLPDQSIPVEWAGRVEVATGDLTEPSTLRGLAQGVTCVFHLAGEIRQSARFGPVNVEGTRNLLAACAAEGRLRVLHLSSVGVIGPRAAGTYDEDSPCTPRNPYEVSKWQGELIARDFGRQNALQVTIARPTIVFGAKTQGGADSFLNWLWAIKSGRFRFIGSDAGIANYVYVEDVAAACLHLAKRDTAINQVYIIADPTTIGEMVTAVTTHLHVRMPGVWPLWFTYPAAVGLEVVGRIIGRPMPLTRDRVRALISRIDFSGDKLRGEYPFPVGWREGLRRTIMAYQRANLL